MSFSLFLIASLAFYGLMANTRRAEAKARQVLLANAYARQLMEAQHVKGYSTLKLGTTKSQMAFSSQQGGVSGQTVMDTEVTVSEGPASGLRSVVVTVAWHQGRVSLESYVSQ